MHNPNIAIPMPVINLIVVGSGKYTMAPITSPKKKGPATMRNHPITSIMNSITLNIKGFTEMTA